MMSQPGLQTTPKYYLPNVSQSKDSQTMKFGQLIEHNKRNIFLAEHDAEWLVQDLLFLKKSWKWRESN